MNQIALKKIILSSKGIDYLGLILIGVFSYCYAFFWSTFAEIHIQLPFFNFPVFVGEILLAVCLSLFIAKFVISHTTIEKWHLLVLFYLGWVLIKSFKGYFDYGPLAFRNAALFYYPLFAVVSFYFFRMEYISPFVVWLLLSCFIVTHIVRQFSGYFLYPYIIISLTLIFSIRQRYLKLLAFLAISFTFPYMDFVTGSRSMFLAHGVSILFLGNTLIFGLWNIPRKFKIIIIAFITILPFLAFVGYGNPNQVLSLTTPKLLLLEFKRQNDYINENKNKFVHQPLNAALYNDNKHGKPNSSLQERIAAIRTNVEDLKYMSEEEYSDYIQEHFHLFKKPEKTKFSGEQYLNGAEESGESDFALENFLKGKATRDIVDPPVAEKVHVAPVIEDLSTEHNNIIFRIFLWRDMWVELLEKEAWLGVSFGQPQRSVSIEMLNQALGEWSRDGWVTPHNGFFHVIYRAGLPGVLFLGILFFSLINMTKRFLKLRSVVGLLLISVIIYWLVIASFLVVLELPYHAIPFWCFWGVTVAYYKHIKEKNGKQCTPPVTA